MQTFFNNRGISLVVLIVIMLGIGLIGGGVASIMMSKQKSYPFALNSFKAYEIANAGAEFAIGYCKNESSSNCQTNIKGSNFTASFGGGGGSFTTSYNSGTDTLTSTGTYSGVTRQVQIVSFSTYVPPSHDLSSEDPAFIASLSPVESQGGQVITVKPTGLISLGKMGTETFGAVWYGGTGATGAPGNCVLGSCDFAKGFRAYFVFQFATGSTGDGFTFAVISGNTGYNNAGSVGGDTSMGELMAYGGDSRKYSPNTPAQNNISTFADHKGMGIVPPKFATEFDIYYNGAGAVCSGAGSRLDKADQYQHMAYVFWGDNSIMGCSPEDTSNYLEWMPSMSYALNAVVSPTTPNGSIYRAIIAGASASPTPTQPIPEPAWPARGSGGAVTESCTTSPCVQWQEVSWMKNTPFVVGDTVAPSTANGRFYRCTKATGKAPKSGNNEPTWCTVNSCKVSDGNLEWTELSPTFVASPPGNSKTYDDNRHTAGSVTIDTNLTTTTTGHTNATSSNSYYTSPTNPTAWLANPSTANPTYAYRMEVVRSNAAGTYSIKSWIKQCTDVTSKPPTWTASTAYAIGGKVKPTTNYGYYYTAQTAGTSGSTEPAWTGRGTTVTDGTVTWVPVPMTDCDMYTNTNFGNTRSDYTDDTPTLNRTITLDSTYNTAFIKFLFGWTVATGAATQIADVWKFGLSFIP